MKRTLPAILCLLVFSSSLSSAEPAGPSEPPSYEAMIEAVSTNLELGDAEGSAEALAEMIKTHPERFEAHFYLAVATFRLGHPDQAVKHARTALEKAPPEEKERVEELITLISQKDKAENLVADADAAFDKGLLAKAAELYRRAYRVDPGLGQIGLKAASLFADRLRRPLDAAALWNRIAAGDDLASAATARQMLADRAKPLDELFETLIAHASREDLILLAEAFPARIEPPLKLAVHTANANDTDSTVDLLGNAVKLGLQPEAIAKEPAFLRLLEKTGENGPFDQFLRDGFGAELSNSMLAQVRHEQKVRRDKDRAAEKARRAAAERDRVLRLEQERRAKVELELRQEQFYAVGQRGPAGGLIFYDKGAYSNGWRYLEAAPDGWSGTAEDPVQAWSENFTPTGAFSDAIGMGWTNTQQILRTTNWHCAAALAQDFVAVVERRAFTDWHLPTERELELFLQVHGRLSGTYWSSTDTQKGTYARAVKAQKRPRPGNARKEGALKVRPVRIVAANPDYSAGDDWGRGRIKLWITPLAEHRTAKVGGQDLQLKWIVAQVVSTGPAGRAGLKVNDILITVDHFPILDGRAIESILATRAGRSIPIRVLRGNQELTFHVDVEPVS